MTISQSTVATSYASHSHTFILLTHSLLLQVECIKLVQSADIVDTRTAKPRRSFFLAEALSMFNVLKCPLHSATDLEHYWYTLHNVCLGTAIILSKYMGLVQ